MTRARKTAADLLAKLNSDIESKNKLIRENEELAKLQERYAEQEAAVRSDLSGLGYSAFSIRDIIKKYSPLPADIVGLLNSALSHCRDDCVKESIVRALCAARDSFDGRELVKLFEQTSDEGLRWAILNTIAIALPHSIDGWLDRMRDTPVGETIRSLSLD